MKNKRNLCIVLFFALAMFVSFTAESQIRIPDTRVVFNFPDGGWKYLKTLQPDKNITVYLYAYIAKDIVDNDGDTIPPFMRIYVHKNYSEDVFDLAYSRYSQQPFQSLEEYVDGLPTKDGIGYIGAYTSAIDGKDYQFRMIYFKDRNNGIEIRLETTRDTFEKMDREFTRVMKSVRVD